MQPNRGCNSFWLNLIGVNLSFEGGDKNNQQLSVDSHVNNYCAELSVYTIMQTA